MKENAVEEKSVAESGTTGLPWPKTWKGAYVLVISFFVVWVALLIALTESFK